MSSTTDYTMWNGWPDAKRQAFVQILVGRRGSGKTNLLVTSLLKGGAYYKMFKRIVIISPTIELDKTWSVIDRTGVDVYEEYSDDVLDKIIESQKTDNSDRLLVILDDCASEKGHKDWYSPLQKIANNGRHLNTSVIVSVQRINHVSTHVRANADSLVSFAIQSPAECAMLYESFGGTRSKQEFYRVLSKSTSVRYTWLNLRVTGGVVAAYAGWERVS